MTNLEKWKDVLHFMDSTVDKRASGIDCRICRLNKDCDDFDKPYCSKLFEAWANKEASE